MGQPEQDSQNGTAKQGKTATEDRKSRENIQKRIVRT
jgi:hypothetical protein